MCSINHCGMNEWLKRPVSKSNCWLQANAICSTPLCGTVLLSILHYLALESHFLVKLLATPLGCLSTWYWVPTLPCIFTAFLSMLIFQTSFLCLVLGCVPPSFLGSKATPCYLLSRHMPDEKSVSADNSPRSLTNYVTQYPSTSPVLPLMGRLKRPKEQTALTLRDSCWL